MTDSEIIERILSGEQELFSELLQKYSGFVWAICSSYVSNPSECEEVVHESFINAYRALATLRDPEKFGSWLSQIARKRSINFLRARKRRRAATQRFVDGGFSRRDAVKPVDDPLAYAEVELRFLEMIDSLPPKTREAMILCHIQGSTISEAAKFLGVSHVAMRKRLSFGRKKLRIEHGEELAEALGVEERIVRREKRMRAIISFGPTPWLNSSTTIPAASFLQKRFQFRLLSRFSSVGIVVCLLLIGDWFWVGIDRVDQSIAPAVAVLASTSATHLEAPELLTSTSVAPITSDIEATKLVESVEVIQVPGEISGRIYDAKLDTGIEGVAVRAWFVDPSKGYCHPVETTTNTMGEYRFSGLLPGSYEVRRQAHQGYSDPVRDDRRVVTLLSSGNMSTVDFAASQGVPVAGLIVDSDGRAAANVNVTMYTGDDGWHRKGISGPDGRFEILASGPSDALFVMAETESELAIPFEPEPLPGEGIENLLLTVNLKGSISGVVTDGNGEIVPGIFVAAEIVDPTGFANQKRVAAKTDSDGQFELVGLGADNYRLTVHQHEKSRDNEKGGTYVTVRPGDSLRDIALRHGDGLTITGRVLNSEQTPVANAVVSWSGRSSGRVRTSADGFFRVANLSDGSYTFLANANGYANTYLRDVKDSMANVQIIVQQVSAVEGSVVGSERGEIISEFEILAMTAGIVSTSNRFIRLHDAQGRFRLDSLDPGDVTIYVRAPGFALTKIDLPMLQSGETKSSVIVALEREGIIEGYVTLGDGFEEVVQIRLNPRDKWMQPEKIGDDGYYRFEGLSSGTVALEVIASAPEKNLTIEGSKSREVLVKRGQISTLDIDFR